MATRHQHSPTLLTGNGLGAADGSRPRLMVIVAVASLLLAGCFGSGGTTSPSTRVGPRSINERDPATLLDCGDLRLPITQFPENFNPLWAGTPPDYASLVKAASYPRPTDH
jgi:peptide/nickel transport system substrate-binding protein